MQNIRSNIEKYYLSAPVPLGKLNTTSFAFFDCAISQVVGVKNGGCKYYDSCFFREIAELFTNSEHCEVSNVVTRQSSSSYLLYPFNIN